MLFEVHDNIRQLGHVTEGGGISSCLTACLHGNLLQGEFCFTGEVPLLLKAPLSVAEVHILDDPTVTSVPLPTRVFAV